MSRSPTADDPRHWTHRDGRTLPVTGTHDDDVCRTCDVPRRVHPVGARVTQTRGHPFASSCPTCRPNARRILAVTFPIGALVSWPTNGGRGSSHGRVIEHGRTRVRVYWHTARPRDVWRDAARLSHVGAELPAGPRRVTGCRQCEAGR